MQPLYTRQSDLSTPGVPGRKENKMNETKKRILKQVTNIRIVTEELSSLVRAFSYVQGGRIPATEETKKALAVAIKDFCDTITTYVDLF